MKKHLLPLVIATVLVATFGCFNAGGALSDNALLIDLELSGYTITPGFSPATTEYTLTVPEAVDQLSVTVNAEDVNASIRVNGELIGPETSVVVVPLQMGANTVAIVVTADDGETQITYTVTVYRASGDSSLANLDISGHTITPGFNPETTDYTLTVPEAVDQLLVTATAEDVNASVSVNGAGVGSGTTDLVLPLVMGSNITTIVVTSEDGTSQSTYTLSTLRASSEATLSDMVLTATSGSIQFMFPAVFDPASTGYFIMGIGRFTITPTAASASAVITVEGIVIASGETTVVQYDYGPTDDPNVYTIEVTAQDGVTVETYTISAAVPAT